MKNQDNLHFNWKNVLCYNKIWNFAIGQRESGKSVSSWLHLWSAFHYRNRPSIVLRRRIADITDAYIMDTETLLNKFLDEPIQLLYMKGDLKSGICDIKIAPAGVDYSWQAIKKLPTFFRIIALSLPMNRIKSLMINNVAYIFFDEFLANLAGGEKYLAADEHFLIQEIYTTYNREASSPIRIICCGNPYTVMNPLFIGLDVDTRKLKPGAFVVGPNYIIDCFQAPPELLAKILASNPMYQFDDAYARYGFGGESINDTHIKLQRTEPQAFKLKFVFKVGKDYLSVHQGSNSITQEEKYWVCKHSGDWLEKVGKRRKIVVFNFFDMVDGSVLNTRDNIQTMVRLKTAMTNRDITFNCIEASYMMEDIYGMI